MSDDEDEPLYPKKTLDRVVGVLYGGVETKTVRVEGRKCQVFPGAKAVKCLLRSKLAEGDDALVSSSQDAERLCEYLRRRGNFARIASYTQEGRTLWKAHHKQTFVSGREDLYVWTYDPPSNLYWGLLLLAGVASLIMMPMWPAVLRQGVMYIALALLIALLFVGTIVRYSIYLTIYAISGGTRHAWLLPNLFADAGVLESFKPFWESKTNDDIAKEKEERKQKRKEKKEKELAGKEKVQ